MHKKSRPLQVRRETLRALTPVDVGHLEHVHGGGLLARRPPPRTGICTTSEDIIIGGEG